MGDKKEVPPPKSESELTGYEWFDGMMPCASAQLEYWRTEDRANRRWELFSADEGSGTKCCCLLTIGDNDYLGKGGTLAIAVNEAIRMAHPKSMI